MNPYGFVLWIDNKKEWEIKKVIFHSFILRLR